MNAARVAVRESAEAAAECFLSMGGRDPGVATEFLRGWWWQEVQDNPGYASLGWYFDAIAEQAIVRETKPGNNRPANA